MKMELLPVLLVIQIVHVAVAVDVPTWSYWPPLYSRATYRGKFISPYPPRVLQKLSASRPINIFDDDDGDGRSTPTLLYGSVLYTRGKTIRESVRGLLSFIESRLNWEPGVARLIDGKRFELQATADNGKSRMVVEYAFQSYLNQVVPFHYEVNFGMNYYLVLSYKARTHRIVVTLDADCTFHLLQHTSTQPLSLRDPVPPLRILSYNVWNFNPPYRTRLKHLIHFVKTARAGIIGFQEMRFDSTFNRGAQVDQFAQQLPEYQFVYQAAMTYLNAQDPLERIEEGPAIFSKYPIVSSDYLLLSRDPNDPNDVHQRVCLHAVIDVPSWGHVDVYVSHLSLSERSREETMVEIWHFIQNTGRGETQVLLGDLNAEPQSRGIRFLQGLGSLKGERTDLQDAFLKLHSEPIPRSKDKIDIDSKFTFPTQNPIKRIDYILFRGKGTVHECSILGQDPTTTAEDRRPVWASDHRGVVVELMDD